MIETRVKMNKNIKSDIKTTDNPIVVGHNVPALFFDGYFFMKKGSGGFKFLDFS